MGNSLLTINPNQ
uniref:Uncharacterized protein n=1 Tax=Anguilla anguilla TaxID=7936 RepID=A0A0E9U0L3_ANGAN